MALTGQQILIRMGVNPAATRNAIIADFLSKGLEGLKHMTDKEVRDTCASYAKRQDPPFPITLTPIIKQRMRSLVLFVKDRVRSEQPVEFPDTTNQAQLKLLLTETLEREKR